MNHRRSERAHFHIFSKAFHVLPPLMYALIVSQPPLRNQTIKPDAPQADPTQADSRSPSNSDLLDVYEILLAQQQLIAQLTQCLLAVLQTEVQFRAEFFDEYRKNHQKINATELIQQCSATTRLIDEKVHRLKGSLGQ
ncbi:MAG: hypothetical protein DMG87_09195 [Acidobacteria bacterium]|jgi:hypothetical protein|nr:MAG: hypothetical protein DMG87_09195 [Acidobacteriota bacterium]